MTRGKNPATERIARHLGVEQAAIDVAAVGSEGWMWPPLAILVPHLVRHRIIALVGEAATLVAVKAVSLVSVQTLWSGPASMIRLGERGRWHT